MWITICRLYILGRLGFKSTVNCTATKLLSISRVPITALESPTFPITRSWPWRRRTAKIITACGLLKIKQLTKHVALLTWCQPKRKQVFSKHWTCSICELIQLITCFNTVTAVVPLQKQSIVELSFSSLSINLKAFSRDSLSDEYVSGSFLFSSTSADSAHSLSKLMDVVSSEFILPGRLPFWRGLLLLLVLALHCVHNLRGSESLTFFATMWPNGPWPSNTPQKMVSLLEVKFCHHKFAIKRTHL